MNRKQQKQQNCFSLACQCSVTGSTENNYFIDLQQSDISFCSKNTTEGETITDYSLFIFM